MALVQYTSANQSQFITLNNMCKTFKLDSPKERLVKVYTIASLCVGSQFKVGNNIMSSLKKSKYLNNVLTCLKGKLYPA